MAMRQDDQLICSRNGALEKRGLVCLNCVAQLAILVLNMSSQPGETKERATKEKFLYSDCLRILLAWREYYGIGFN